MSNTERNRFEVIFSPYRELAGIELYNRNACETIDVDQLEPLLYVKPGCTWEDSRFVICTKKGQPDIILHDIGFRVVIGRVVVPISLKQAIRFINSAKANATVS